MQIQITPFGGGDSSVSVMADQPFDNDQYHTNTAKTTSESYHVVCGENLNSENPSERVAQICASHGDVFFNTLSV